MAKKYVFNFGLILGIEGVRRLKSPWGDQEKLKYSIKTSFGDLFETKSNCQMSKITVKSYNSFLTIMFLVFENMIGQETWPRIS